MSCRCSFSNENWKAKFLFFSFILEKCQIMGREFQPIRIQDEKILTNKKQRSGNDLIAGKCVWINLTFPETSSIKKNQLNFYVEARFLQLLREGFIIYLIYLILCIPSNPQKLWSKSTLTNNIVFNGGWAVLDILC